MRTISAGGRRLQLRLMAGAAFGAAIGLAFGIISGRPSDALALSCGTKPPVPPGGCQTSWFCDTEVGRWEPLYAGAGTACNDGDSCTVNDVCDGSGGCGGSPSCPPAAPGPTSGPSSTVTNGAYTISWGRSVATPNVSSYFIDRYEVFENGALLYSFGNWIFSANISGRGDGTYRYNVRACNVVGCSAFNADYFVTVLWPPGPPAALNLPPDSGPDFAVSWTPGTGRSDRYDLGESPDGINWPTTYSVVGTSKAISGKAWGSKFWYRVRACNPSGCSAYTAAKSVDIVSWLTTVADQPLVAPAVPAQGWVGTIAGTPATEGGAAVYRVPIEVPPGRAGMQPDVALTYGSRNGNGVAGVGWSLSAVRTIYRCPRTLAQDGGNRPVQHDSPDRICLDGQRLIGVAGTYGVVGSEYRTEVDQFARIKLQGAIGINSWDSIFQVEHKSGRTSIFLPMRSGSSVPPDVWYLDSEYDRNGNCIKYNYTTFSMRGLDLETVLSSIAYTGTGTNWCTTGADARTIEFTYTGDREDKRTTYRFGVATPMTARLAAISTRVGAQYVRRYQLAYGMSGATRRSLLQSVTLCAGATCGAEQLPATTFSYQNEPQSFDFLHLRFDAVPPAGAPFTQGQTLGTDWRAAAAPDYDGDGRREHVYDQFASTGARTRYIDPRTCPTSIALDGTSWLKSIDKPADVMHVERSEDLDGDGRADVIGSQAGNFAFGTLNCDGSLNPLTRTNLPLDGSSSQTFAAPIDYDGDGIIDLGIGNLFGNTQTIVRRRTKDLIDWNANVDVFLTPATPAGMAPQTQRDLNGDGLIDTVFDTPPNQQTQDATKVTFFKGVDQMRAGGPAQAYATSYLANITTLGQSPASAFGDHNQRRWIDVNGDGLPDIYEPGFVWINQGGAVGSQNLFRRVSVAMPPNPPNAPADPANYPERAKYAFTMDVDGDGLEELMVPSVRTVSYCGGDKKATLPSGDPAWFCGDDFDTAPANWRTHDHSIFRWNAYKFIEQADGSYALIGIPTNLQAPIGTANGNNPVDWDGDGMTDVRFDLVNGLDGDFYAGLAASDLGPYVSQGHSRAPDLLTGVTNGVGATASWAHQPLSQKDTIAAGCDMPSGQSFYVAHHGDPDRSTGYVYFTSSMWTVSRFEVSNGVGIGTNKTCYRYQDAMLNNEGRGFQGFKLIVAEEQLPLDPSEDTAAGYSGCGGTCSPNNLRTTTEFHQEFPLTSRPKRITMALAKPAGTSLGETTYWWHAEQGNPGVWVVYSPATLEKKFDLPQGTMGAPPLATQTQSVSEVQLISGEATRSCVVVNGQTPVPGTTTPLPATARDVIRRDTRTIANDTLAWWLGKVTSREVLSDFFTGTLSLNETCLVTGTSARACAASPQVCPAVTASADAKIQTTNYVWNPDSAASGAKRKLQSETVVLRSVTEAASAYDYDGFGNVTGTHVTGRDISGELLTTYTYTMDGYFRATETRRPTATVQHVTTVTVDAATGLPTYRQEIQGAPATTTAYDSLGRVLTVRTDGMPAVDQRLSCRTPPPNCIPKRQEFRAGAPIKTEYPDLLGRVVATGMEGFDGLEIVTRVDYNQRGLKIAEYAPWKGSVLPGQWNGAATSAFVTQYSRVDALGRVGRKTVVRASAGLFETGRGEATLTTDYAYVPVDIGLRTDITVNKPTSQGGSLKMSRTYDRRGKLVATTQSTTSTHAIPANYFYDSAGYVRMILDASGNKLTATYDDVGRKTRVDDPDRGIWTYAWDGIGRLETQTDARGIVVSHGYDGVGRLVQRSVKTPTDPTPVLEATWSYDLNGKLGVLGALIGADGFRRDYLYDSLVRPFNVKTSVPGSVDWSAQTFIEEYGYDHNYGRLKAMSYPSSEFVALDYDSRGNQIGETALAANGTRGTVYRRVRSMSVRGQVTLQDLGNGITETAQYDDSTGMPLELSATGLRETPPTNCPTATAPLVRQVDYTYDHFLNLAKQVKQFHLRAGGTGAIQFSSTCQPLGAAATESYQYDDLQRLLGSSRSWTGLTPGAGTTLGDTYAYDDLGNFTRKSDYGDSYAYGTSRISGSAGPHAVVSVSNGGVPKATFTYDANGNLVQGDGRTIAFDSLDRPIMVTMGSVTTQFRYAPDGGRYLQRTTGAAVSPTAKTVYYVEKDYERIVWSSGAVEEKTYMGPSVAIYRNGAMRDVRYLHRDHLGSTDSVTNAGAFELTSDAHGFDAFGKPRGRDWQPSPAPGTDKLHPSGNFNVTTERGFTGHEHLDDTFLIHMNGRTYDYRLGRFLSVDPIISNPANSQSINPYSYIGNNPLSGVDPTGYQEDLQTDSTSQKTYRPHDGTLTHDAKFSGALNTSNDVIAHGGSNNGAGYQTAQQAGSNPATQSSPGQIAQTSQGDAGQNPSPERTSNSSSKDPEHQGYKIFGTPTFIKEVEAQIEILRETATGAGLLKQLDASPFTVRIKEGSESRIFADDDRAATDGTGSGSAMRHNPTATPLVSTAYGPMPTPPAVVLGHELAHAVDISKGEFNTRRNAHTGVPRFEERAMKMENLIRRELGGVRVGLPDRTGYRLEQ